MDVRVTTTLCHQVYVRIPSTHLPHTPNTPNTTPDAPRAPCATAPAATHARHFEDVAVSAEFLETIFLNGEDVAISDERVVPIVCVCVCVFVCVCVGVRTAFNDRPVQC